VETKHILFDVSNFNIDNRSKIFVNEELLIGENKKQLENGYYDFKISNKEEILIITLNKLWYEKYNSDYIQDDYLAKICKEIVECIEISNIKEDLEYYLYKYVKDNYLKVKQGQVSPKLELDKISIWSKSVNSECVIYVKVE